MEVFLKILIILLITTEIVIFSFCKYWRENNPWKWFFVKLLTTISLIIMICWGKETYGNCELIVVTLFSMVVGIDFAHTYITANNSKMID